MAAMAGKHGTSRIPASPRVPNVPGPEVSPLPVLLQGSRPLLPSPGESEESAPDRAGGWAHAARVFHLFNVFVLGGMWRGRFGPAGEDAD
ncbi:hypothetical protein NN561_019601 [Cricetulus griseus]